MVSMMWRRNIIHLVLARVEDAPKGVKGLSLFIVPKYLVNEDGSLGARNNVEAIGLVGKNGAFMAARLAPWLLKGRQPT